MRFFNLLILIAAFAVECHIIKCKKDEGRNYLILNNFELRNVSFIVLNGAKRSEEARTHVQNLAFARNLSLRSR